MSKSLWGAPVTTEPTPFDEITPEMLEGVGGSKQTYPHEHRCPGCYISKPCNSACSIEPDQSDWQRERLVRSRGAVAVCDTCSVQKHETVKTEQPEPVNRSTKPCFFCENATFDGTECEHCGRVHAVSQPELPTLRDITADELETMGLRLRASQPEPPPTGNGELVTPPLLRALQNHPDLYALVSARDAFGRSKYGTGLRCHNGRDPLEDARQELGDLLQYLWQSLMEGRSISGQLDLMAQAITILQGAKR